MSKSGEPKFLVAADLNMDEIMRSGLEKKMLAKRAQAKKARERAALVGTELNLVDKNGKPLFYDDVVYNGSDYYRIYTREGAVEMLSCTKGYLHDVKQEDLSEFEWIGQFIGNEKLFDCD